MCSHYRIVANMPYLSPAMRKVAPELSREMDELRKERKTLVERRCYVTTAGVEGVLSDREVCSLRVAW